MTYEQIILKWLEWVRTQDKNGGWVREYEIRCKDTPFGWIGARGDRTTRDLIKERKIEAKMDGKYRVVRGFLKEEPIIKRDEVVLSGLRPLF